MVWLIGGTRVKILFNVFPGAIHFTIGDFEHGVDKLDIRQKWTGSIPAPKRDLGDVFFVQTGDDVLTTYVEDAPR